MRLNMVCPVCKKLHGNSDQYCSIKCKFDSSNKMTNPQEKKQDDTDRVDVNSIKNQLMKKTEVQFKGGCLQELRDNAMKQENKARQFWIDPSKDDLSPDDIYFGEALKTHPRQGPLLWQSNLIHVIEYRAVEELEQKLAAAESENAELKRKVEEMRDALISIGEYWNGGRESAYSAIEYATGLANETLERLTKIGEGNE